MLATWIATRILTLLLSCCVSIHLCVHSWRQSKVESKLKLAIVLFRHGDRSPAVTFPNDRYKESSWPEGFGQLTQLGKEQQFELGKYLRKRYSEFLSETYKTEEVYVRSTDMDRTILSAQANLAGLFQPRDQSSSQNITWQPIPVHTVPLEDEKILFLPPDKCHRFYQLKEETYESQEHNDLVKPYMDFLKSLEKHTGYTSRQLKDPSTWWDLYDALHCEASHNFSLPFWVTNDVMNKFRHLAELSIKSDYGMYKQQEKSRVTGGILLKAILENIRYDRSLHSKKKLIMYSSHDSTIVALQMALNVYNGMLPPYASCHFIELYQDENGSPSIQMYYRNDTSVDPYPIALPGCSQSCPLERFTELTSSVIAEDFKRECGIKEKDEENNKKTSWGIVTGLSVAVGIQTIIVFGLLYLVYYQRKKLLGSNYETLELQRH
ncbi:prostatic acid phosphatase-like [Gastrophryne carolinensis]